MRTRALLSAVLVSFLMAAPALAQEYTYKTVDVGCVTGATKCPAGLTPGALAAQTAARGINAGGDIVGFYIDAAGQQHGFLSREWDVHVHRFPARWRSGDRRERHQRRRRHRRPIHAADQPDPS